MTFHTILQILISSFAATSVMTLCSYVISASARELYKEPVLLTYVLSSLHIEIGPNLKKVLSWIFHYLIGLFFVIGYHFVWSNQLLEISWASSIILGAIIGTIGIIGWVILFNLVPQKPNIDYKGYYIQLFIVHVIFSITAFQVYKLFL